MSELLSGVDPNVLVLFAGGVGAMFLLLILGLTVAVMARPRARLKQRMTSLGLVPAGTVVAGARSAAGSNRQRRVQERLQELQAKGRKRRGQNQLRQMLLEAGVEMNMRSFTLMSVAVGLGGAVVYMLTGYPAYGAPAAALFAGLMLPRWALRFKARRRQKLFTKNFANAIDVLVRGIKTGLPVGECLAIIGRESPEPIGQEFRLMVEGQKLGISLDELLRRGLERIPTPEYKFFAIVIQIQQQTGGNLAETLENLSRVLRERKKLRDKVKALSAEAKASALIIGSLPFFVMLAVRVMSPAYLDPLFFDPTGQTMLIGAGVWMLVGVGVMAKMINFKI